MDETEMKKMFELSQQNTASRGLEITPEEAEKFKTAFDDPEFCKLMAEYVAELQDPNNRAETESYISQLEGENKVPEGKELVRPVAGFVAKTKKTEGGSESKIFINVVSSEKIAAPTKKSTPQGQNWSLPYSLGPPHMESDKGGDAVPAFDCCFHPEALQFGSRSKQFRDLLVSTAISGIEEAYRRQKQQVTLKKEFHVLKGVSYKSGQIPTMLLDLAGKNKWSDAAPTAAAPAAPVATKPVENKEKSAATAPAVSPAIQKGFLNKASAKTKPPATSPAAASSPATAPLVQVLSTDDQPSPEVKRAPAPPASGPTSPEFTMTERGILNIGDFGAGGGMQVSSTRPAELVYRIDIPLVAKTSQVELDVGERDLRLKYGTVYDLHIKLPYPVFDKRGVAKFDKAKKQLCITIPVQPAILPTAASSSPTDGGGDSNGDGEEVSLEQEEEKAVPHKVATKSKEQPTKSHGRWVEGKQSEVTSEESRRLAEEVRTKAQEAQRLAAEEAARSPARAPAGVPPPTVPETEALAEKETEETETRRAFIPAAMFVGRKAGYVFKRGESGLGYHLDPYQSPVSVPAQPVSMPSPPSPSSSAPLPPVPSPASPKAAPSSSFLFEFRQTKEAVAVILQVPGIIESTVDLRFGKKSFDIFFKAVSSSSSPASPGSGSGSGLAEYAQGFDLFEEVLVEKCKYDVATQNLVVLLHKAAPEYWIDKTPPSASGGRRREVLTARPYRASQETPAAVSVPLAAAVGDAEGGGAREERRDGSRSVRNIPPVPSPAELLEAMKFSTQGLLDLD